MPSLNKGFSLPTNNFLNYSNLAKEEANDPAGGAKDTASGRKSESGKEKARLPKDCIARALFRVPHCSDGDG